jgi:hypothetical protein
MAKRTRKNMIAPGVELVEADEIPGLPELPFAENPLANDGGALHANPFGTGLFDNPNGFGGDALRALGIVSTGVGVGYTVAELADRFVATRGNKEPWYGRDAAAYQQSRPDALRLGVQAAGAVAGIAGASMTSGPVAWLLGGLSIGFGANLVRMGLNYYVMPMILPVEDASNKTLGNRLYPLEQEAVQTKVTAYLEAKQKAQLAEQTPISPLNSSPPTIVEGADPGMVYLGSRRHLRSVA